MQERSTERRIDSRNTRNPRAECPGVICIVSVSAEDICRLCVVGGHSVVNSVAVLLYEAVVELVHFIGGVVLVSGLLIVNALFKGGLDLVRFSAESAVNTPNSSG